MPRGAGAGPGLAASSLPRVVVVEDRTYRVRPPTVREALELLAALPGAAKGDEEDAAVVQDVLEGWLSPELLELLPELRTKARWDLLRHLVYQGADLKALAARAKRGKRKGARQGPLSSDWRMALAEYCQVYGGDPWEVYDRTPFPFFLELLGVIDSAAAQAALRNLRWAAIPHMGKGARDQVTELTDTALGMHLVGVDPGASEDTRSDMARLKDRLAGRGGWN